MLGAAFGDASAECRRLCFCGRFGPCQAGAGLFLAGAGIAASLFLGPVRESGRGEGIKKRKGSRKRKGSALG